MPNSGTGRPQWGQGKVGAASGSVERPASSSHSSPGRPKEGGTSPPQWGHGRRPSRAKRMRT